MIPLASISRLLRRKRTAVTRRRRLARPVVEVLEDRILLAANCLNPLAEIWAEVADSPFVPAFLDRALTQADSNSETVSNFVTETLIPQVESLLPESLDLTAEITFAIGVEGEVGIGPDVGFLGANLNALELGTGYNLTFDCLDKNWKLSRATEVRLIVAKGSLEYFVKFPSLLNIQASDEITFGVTLAVGSELKGQVEGSSVIGLIGEAELLGGGNLSFTAETTLEVGDFLANYVEQDSFYLGLADVFIPYVGDTWWQNLLSQATSFVPVVGLQQLLDLSSKDTPLGILAASGDVTVTVKRGGQLSAAAWLGLGGKFPGGVGQVDLKVKAGLVVAVGVEQTIISTEDFSAAAGKPWMPRAPVPPTPADVAELFQSTDARPTGVTIVTHGFQPTSSGGDSLLPLAQVIHAKAGGWLLDYDVPATGLAGYFDPSGSRLPRAVDSGKRGEVVLVFDWAAESAQATGGWGEAAGDALFSLLIQLGLVDPTRGQDNVPLHFIGHGFGAVVTSEAIERLAAYGVPVDHVTFLDPHDFQQVPVFDAAHKMFELGEPFGYGASVWNNVEFADVYYETRGLNGVPLDGDIVVPHGRPIPGAYNQLLNDNLPLNPNPIRNPSNVLDPWNPYGITDPSGDYSYVWNCFYAATVIGSLPASCAAPPSPIAYAGTGYAFSRLARGESRRPASVFFGPGQDHRHDSTPFVNRAADRGFSPAEITAGRWEPNWDRTLFVNGDFEHPADNFQIAGFIPVPFRTSNIEPGWSHHGGGGLGHVDADGGQHYLELDRGNAIRTHNRLYVAPETTHIVFDLWRSDSSADDRLHVRFGDDFANFALDQVDSGFDPNNPVRLEIPRPARGRLNTVSFEIVAGDGTIDAEVRIDNVRFEANGFLARTGDVIRVDLKTDAIDSNFELPTFDATPDGLPVLVEEESTGIFALSHEGVLPFARLVFSERVDAEPFATSGRFYFVPGTDLDSESLDDDLDRPGFQGLLHGHFTVNGEPRDFQINVIPDYSTSGLNAVTPGSATLEVLRLQHRLRFLGFPDPDGNPLEVDGGTGPRTRHAIGLFNAAVHPTNHNHAPASQINLDWINDRNAPRWVELHARSGLEIFRGDEQPERWATSWAAELIAAASARWQADPTTPHPNLAMLGASLQQGGDTPFHQSHEAGMDVDFETPSTNALFDTSGNLLVPFFAVIERSGTNTFYVAAKAGGVLVASASGGYESADPNAPGFDWSSALQATDAWDNLAVLDKLRDPNLMASAPGYNLDVVRGQITAFSNFVGSPTAGGVTVENILYNDPRTWDIAGGEFVKFFPDHGGHFHVNIGLSLLTDADQQVIVEGLKQLQKSIDTAGQSGPLAHDLVIVDQSAGDGLASAEAVEAGLVDPAENYFATDETPTHEELAAALEESNGSPADTNSAAAKKTHDVSFTKTKMIRSVPLNLSTLEDDLGLELDAAATVDLVATIVVDLTFGMDQTEGLSRDEKFFVRVRTLTGSLSIDASDVDFTARLGFLGAGVENGTIALDVNVAFEPKQPEITLGELRSGPFSALFDVTTPAPAPLDVVLPVVVGLGTTANCASPMITIHDADIFDAPAPAFSATGFDDLLNFRNITPEAALAMLNQFNAWLGQFRDSPVFDVDIPFTSNQTLGSAFDLQQAFVERLVNPLKLPDGRPNYRTSGDLGERLAVALGIDPTGIEHHYDCGTHDLLYHVQFTHEFNPVVVPIDISVHAGTLAEFATDATVSLEPEVTVDFRFGVDLSSSVSDLSLTEDFFVKDVSITGVVTAMATDIDAIARLGSLGVQIIDGTASATGEISLQLKDPGTHASDGRITLGELIDGLGDISTLVESSETDFSATFFLPVSADPFDLGDVSIALSGLVNGTHEAIDFTLTAAVAGTIVSGLVIEPLPSGDPSRVTYTKGQGLELDARATVLGVHVDLAGDFDVSGPFSIAATAEPFMLGAVTVALAGTLSRGSDDTIHYSVKADVAGEVFAGLVIEPGPGPEITLSDTAGLRIDARATILNVGVDLAGTFHATDYFSVTAMTDPFDIGGVNVELSGNVSRMGTQFDWKLCGNTTSPWELLPFLTIDMLQVCLDPAKIRFETTTDILSFKDVHVQGDFNFSNKSFEIMADAALPNDGWKPVAGVEVTLNAVFFAISNRNADGSKGNVRLSAGAETSVLGTDFVAVVTVSGADPIGVLVAAKPKANALFKPLPGIDMDFDAPVIAVSTHGTVVDVDTLFEVSGDAGGILPPNQRRVTAESLNFFASTIVPDSVPTIGGSFVEIAGVLSANLAETKIEGKINLAEPWVAIPDFRLFEFHSVGLFITGLPSVGLFVEGVLLKDKIPKLGRDLPVKGSLTIAATVPGPTLSGSLELLDRVDDVFGVEGLNIACRQDEVSGDELKGAGNCGAIEAGINFGTTPFPTLTGAFDLTVELPEFAVQRLNLPSRIGAAGKLDVATPILVMSVQGWTPFNNLGVGLDSLLVRNAEVAIAPQGGSIGSRVFEKGFSAAFDATIFGTDVHFEGLLNQLPPAIKLEAYVSALEIAGIEITGAGPDGIYEDGDDNGTTSNPDPDADNGAYYKLEVTAAEQSLAFSGRINLPGKVSSGAQAFIALDGEFDTSGVMLDGVIHEWRVVPNVLVVHEAEFLLGISFADPSDSFLEFVADVELLKKNITASGFLNSQGLELDGTVPGNTPLLGFSIRDFSFHFSTINPELSIDFDVVLPIAPGGNRGQSHVAGMFDQQGFGLHAMVSDYRPIPGLTFTGTLDAVVGTSTPSLNLDIALGAQILNSTVNFEGLLSASPAGFDLFATATIDTALVDLAATIDLGMNSPFSIELAADFTLPGSRPADVLLAGKVGTGGVELSARVDNWGLVPGLSFDGSLEIAASLQASSLVVVVDVSTHLLGSRLSLTGPIVVVGGALDLDLSGRIQFAGARFGNVKLDLEVNLMTDPFRLDFRGDLELFAGFSIDVTAAVSASSSGFVFRAKAIADLQLPDFNVGPLTVDLHATLTGSLSFGTNLADFSFGLGVKGWACVTVSPIPTVCTDRVSASLSFNGANLVFPKWKPKVNKTFGVPTSISWDRLTKPAADRSEPRVTVTAKCTSVIPIACGTIEVRGTAAPEVTRAYENGSRIVVQAQNSVGEWVTLLQRARAQVIAIDVDTRGGNDSIDLSLGSTSQSLNVRPFSLPAVLRGGTGRDVIRGGTGPNTIYGGTGGLEPPGQADFRVADDAGDELFGGLATDSIFGEEGNDVIGGGGGSDAIAGGSGVNLINGRLEVRGTDRPERIKVFRDLQTETACIQNPFGGSEQCFTITTVDDIVVQSSSGTAPAITLGRFARPLVASLDVDARGGNDRIEIDASIVVPTVLHGGAGHDAIQGGGGIDTAFGDVGLDLLMGGPADLLDGGPGTNISLVAGQLDFMGTADPERFELTATMLFSPCEQGGSLRVPACQDAVRVRAINGANGETATFLLPLTAISSLHANTRGGDDTILVAAALSTPADFDLGPGNDFAQAGSGPTTIHGGDGDDQLMGGPGNDAIFGEADDDVINCGGGSDLLDGGPGVNDVSCGANHPPTIDPIGNYVVDEGSTLTFTVTATDSDNDSSDESTGESPTPTFIGPIAYLSHDDSPFGSSDGGADFSYLHLEDFEDGELNVPGVTALAGAVFGTEPASPLGLVSWYRAEGNAEDSAGGNDGNVPTGVTFAPGKVGQAFRFNGDRNVVTVPDSNNLDFAAGDSITLAAWLYRTSGLGHFLGKRPGCDNPIDYQMLVGGDESFQFGAEPGTGIGGGKIPLNTWTHVAATVDAATATWKAYVNGELVGTTTGGALGPANAAPLTIGSSGSCAGFTGLIDEVQLYNRALSASEIRAIGGAVGLSQGNEIYRSDFESEVESEWTRRTTDTTPIGSREFLGQFGNETVSLSLGTGSPIMPGGLPDHEQVTVSFDLFVLRTWDGNHPGGGAGPDVWDLSVRGGPTLLHTTFNNGYPGIEPFGQAFPDAFPGGQHPIHTAAAAVNTLGFTFPGLPGNGVIDSVYNLTFTFPHSTSSVAFDFTGMLSTPGFDESWGLDNVTVSLHSAQPGSGPVPDSVDADDGTIDGDGSGGHSFIHDSAADGITFSFDAETLGALPTHVGIVWTDGGPVADVDFEAFDADGDSLGIARGDDLGDATNDGTTAEDRFFGVTYAAGISAIKIRDSGGSFIEVDHLLFGHTEPAPPPPPQTLRFSLEPDAPAGASIDPETGVLTWSPSETQGPRDYSVTVRVADNGSPSLSALRTFMITVNEVNEPPALGHIPSQTVTQSQPLSFIVEATDPDRPANGLDFSLDAGAVAGAAIDSRTGMFTWTPSADMHSPGVYEVTVRVTDRGTPALSDSQIVAITVVADLAPPTINRVRLNSNGQLITEIVLSVSEKLNTSSARNVANYRLIAPGKDGEFGTADDVSAAPASALYNSAAQTVLLTPAKPLRLNQLFKMVVVSPTEGSAAGLTDVAGNPLDGDGGGTAGGNFIVFAGRSNSRITYRDSTGDTVSLTITRGLVDLLLGPNGEAIHLSLHDGPGKSTLRGRVTTRNRKPSTTTIRLVTGNDGIRFSPPLADFQISEISAAAVDELLASGVL